MIREEGLTSGQKASLGALTPALIFVPVVFVLAMLRSDGASMNLSIASLSDPLMRLFWGLVTLSLLALVGFVLATMSRRREASRRGQLSTHTY